MPKLFWQLVGKPKLQEKLRKRSYTKNKLEYNGCIEIKILDKSAIKTQNFYN